jgi:hypothetical protein
MVEARGSAVMTIAGQNVSIGKQKKASCPGGVGIGKNQAFSSPAF